MIVKRENFSSVTDFVCSNTGMTEEELLNDKKTYRIDGLSEVKDMLLRAMASQKTIYVFGDYDVDGVCASAIIKIGMTAAGYGDKTIVRLPKRFSEGYGVSEKAVDEFKDGQVLITVDNGIAALGAVKKAKEKGMQVIVIDHHLPQMDEDGNIVLPEADIIIDPKAIPGSADFDGYCGAGLAYRAMYRMVRQKNTIWKMITLAAIATIADAVPLAGENRRIVKFGLSSMTDSRRATSGLYALLLAYECTEHVTEETVSFKIAPCLNAPGRLFDDGAYTSYSLLSYDGSLQEAKRMAEQQTEWNKTRRALSDEWTAKAIEQADAHALMGKKPAVLFIDGIPEGIIGIVAGRAAEHAKCPCIILARSSDDPGILKGSARSYGDTHLYNLIREGAEFLTRFGGHKEAAGLSVREQNLDSFRERMYRAYQAQHTDAHQEDNNLYYDLEADGQDGEALRGMLEDIQRYAPYGHGNPQPVLFIKGLLLTPMRSGYFQYMTNRTAVRMSSKELDFISFHDVEQFERIGAPAVIDALGTASVNHYMGDSRHRLEFSYIQESRNVQKKQSALARLIAQRAAERPQACAEDNQ